jgi:hypothetical protein
VTTKIPLKPATAQRWVLVLSSIASLMVADRRAAAGRAAAAFSLAGAVTALWLPRRRDLELTPWAELDYAARTDIHALPAS